MSNQSGNYTKGSIIRAAFYGRYSTQIVRPASTEDLMPCGLVSVTASLSSMKS
jgi:hypothetical protein